jgi:hypothetical protein
MMIPTVQASPTKRVDSTAVNLESEAEAERDTGLTDEEWMQTQEDGWRR